MNIYMYVWAYVNMYVYVWAYVNMYAYIWAYMYVNVYAYVCVYINSLYTLRSSPTNKCTCRGFESHPSSSFFFSEKKELFGLVALPFFLFRS